MTGTYRWTARRRALRSSSPGMPETFTAPPATDQRNHRDHRVSKTASVGGLLATTFMHGGPDNGFGPTASNLYLRFETTGASRFPGAEIRWRGPPAYGLIYQCGRDVKCATPARPLPRRSRPKRDSSFAMIARRSWTSRSRNLNFRLPRP